MRDLEQRTVRLTDPEVSLVWLQDNAWWLVFATIVGLLLVLMIVKAWRS